MKLDEKLLILFILLFFLSFSYAVLKTASDRIEIIKEKHTLSSLPQKCIKYYEDGTDRWKDCMGVGYK